MSKGSKICICVPKRFHPRIRLDVESKHPDLFHNCPFNNGNWSTGKHSPRKTIELFLDFAIAMRWTSLAHIGSYFLTKDFKPGEFRKEEPI